MTITSRINFPHRYSFLSTFIFTRKTPKGLPVIEALEKVSPRVTRILGFNPGAHTLQGTNTYLIGTGSEKILIDAGENATAQTYVPFLLDALSAYAVDRDHPQPSITAVLLTHGHGDHMGGVIPLLRALSQRNMPLPKVYKRNIASGNFPAVGFPCEDIQNNQIFRVEGASVRAVYTPGHTDDHVSFIVEEDAALLSGDCVLGCGTCVFDNLHQYLDSLRLLADLMRREHIAHCYPGHGPVIRDGAVARIEEYIYHRGLRETQILDCLESIRINGQGNAWSTSRDITALIYGNISWAVKLSAQYVVGQHLDKLHKDGSVECRWPDLWRLNVNEVKKT